MNIYKLKSLVRRGSMLLAAAVVVTGAILPAAPSFADALNPLTHRSLTLSSSAPGWDNTDGSGNTTYAQPNSGANGQKTGNTFAFQVSSGGTTVKAFTFQYCTSPAGYCSAPGNNTGDTHSSGTRAANDTTTIAAHQSDLEVVAPTATEISTYATNFNTDGSVKAVPSRTGTESFAVLTSTDGGTTWDKAPGGWAMVASSAEDVIPANTNPTTGKNNYITLKSTTGFTPAFDQKVKIVFFGTDANYITNPGAGSFFVKINDYTSDSTQNSTTLVDGGVTVANVMNQSIEIQTKVLETMEFSVGTVDPTTLTDTELSTATNAAKTSHGVCDGILQALTPVSSTNPANTLQLGDTSAENSLRTDTTYSTHSYWRLSSNSSAGATVYYSGVTLSNTVGDQIKPIGSTSSTPGDGIAAAPHPGTEQFGLALDNGTRAVNGTAGPTLPTDTVGKYQVNYATEASDSTKLFENAADISKSGIDASTTTEQGGNGSYHDPQLYPLIPATNYDSGSGVVNAGYTAGATINTKFAFDTESNLIPTPIATENSKVVDCVTGKMRYIANIAATTPAGIYTTKINYIAAPQY